MSTWSNIRAFLSKPPESNAQPVANDYITGTDVMRTKRALDVHDEELRCLVRNMLKEQKRFHDKMLDYLEMITGADL